MNVLFADDSSTIRFLMKKMLESLGYHDIIMACDGEEAKFHIDTNRIDLILSDLNMPGISGIDLLKYVRSNPATAEVPFMMVTTVHDKRKIVEAVKLGLQYYVLKPVDRAVLQDKLTALSQSHGIDPPVIKLPPSHATQPSCPAQAAPQPESGNKRAQSDSAHTDASAHALRQCVEDIIRHFFLVFDGELIMSDFEECIAGHLFPGEPDSDHSHDVRELAEEMRQAAGNGLTALLSSRLRRYFFAPRNDSKNH